MFSGLFSPSEFRAQEPKTYSDMFLRVTRDDARVTLSTLRVATVLSRNCFCAALVVPYSTKKVMSYSHDGPGACHSATADKHCTSDWGVASPPSNALPLKVPDFCWQFRVRQFLEIFGPPNMSGKFRSIFIENFGTPKQVFRANFILQTCRLKLLRWKANITFQMRK